MDLNLTGKTAFITGSTAGIGYGCAKILAQEGAQVILNGRSQASVDGAVARLQEELKGALVTGHAADFSDAQQVTDLLERLPRVDILINNVGIYTSQSFYDSSDQDWTRQHEVNVMSGVRLSRQILPQMKKKGWGRIIFISSECPSLVPEDLIAYSATKAAISRGLAQLTRGTDVTVNTIVPGSTMTEGAQDFLSNLASQTGKTVAQAEADFFKDIRTSSLIERFVSVEEVASTIAYIASPLSAGTNGSTIKIDGGSMGGIL